MNISRQVQEGRLSQGVDEAIAYNITSTPWGSSPTSIAVVAYDVTLGGRTDVSVTVLVGVASAVGDVITLPRLQSLTADKTYRIEVKFVCSGNTFEAFFYVESET